MAAAPPARIDEAAARAQFEDALSSHEQAFETFFFARFMGLSFEYLPLDAPDADKEVCRLSFRMHDMLRNPQGVLQGGVVAAALDISMGHLLKKVQGAGATIEIKVQYLRPVSDGLVTCEGRFTKKGRAVSFMESRMTDADGKLAALATATWKMPD
jgi:uncharacterized protein (TIGR00369 family)